VFQSSRMLDALDITEADAAGLSELAALDLAMAKDFAARAQAAEAPQVANELARSYQRMARSYRQSLALKVRLKREIVRAAQEIPPDPVDEDRIARRISEVREPMQKILWNVHQHREAPEREALVFCEDLDDLDAVLRERAERPDFGQAPLDDDIVAVCAEFDIPEIVARAWRDLDRPPGRHFLDWLDALKTPRGNDSS
jgi:hypothetical protein